MAENLATIEPWMFRSTFADSWISEASARDAETLTKALQKSLSNHQSDIVSSDAVSPYFSLFKPESVLAQTPSGSGSGSDFETPGPKRRNSAAVTAGGKIAKPKSRASKRTTTTFITADPANFRQMVQQATGVRFGNGQMPVTAAPVLLKPEPQRPPFNRLQGCLPTLDTSAFWLDHHHNQQVGVVGGPTSTRMAQAVMSSQPSLAVVADGGVGFDFESFPSFPTLESWN